MNLGYLCDIEALGWRSTSLATFYPPTADRAIYKDRVAHAQ